MLTVIEGGRVKTPRKKRSPKALEDGGGSGDGGGSLPPSSGSGGTGGGSSGPSPSQLELIQYMTLVMPNRTYKQIMIDVNALPEVRRAGRQYTFNQIKHGIEYWRRHGRQIGTELHYVSGSPLNERYSVVVYDHTGVPFTSDRLRFFEEGAFANLQEVHTLIRHGANQMAAASAYAPTASLQQSMEEACDDLTSTARQVRRIINELRDANST